MGEVIIQNNNVMFDHGSKDEYHPLPARITSQSTTLTNLYPSLISHYPRALLHQCRTRGPPISKYRLHIKSIAEWCSCIFLWVFMDKVNKFPACWRIILTLFSSIIPCLSLRGVAASIALSRSLRAKVLLCEIIPTHSIDVLTFAVNAQNDRETDGYSAVEYIRWTKSLCYEHWRWRIN